MQSELNPILKNQRKQAVSYVLRDPKLLPDIMTFISGIQAKKSTHKKLH